jgi:hypothetical protein
MRWNDRDQYYQKSSDGRYSVCAIGYAQGEWFYEAWQTRAHEEGPHLIATNLPSAEEARRLCEEHHNAPA